MQYFEIGDICFALSEGDYNFLNDAYTENFRITEQQATQCEEIITYKTKCDLLVKYKTEIPVKDNRNCELHKSSDGNVLIFHWLTCRLGLAFMEEMLTSRGDVEGVISFQMKKIPPMSVGRFFSLAGMHSKFLHRGGIVLHASYIARNGYAILFTAPSGTGKSTQAKLWEMYESAEIINGDRVLLKEKNGVWNAYGYPCCGSSDICKNVTLPIKLIVVLEQSANNQVEILDESKKVRSLLTGTEVFRWNLDEIDRALNIGQMIIKNIPIVQLNCRPDEDAVRTLKQYVEEQL